MTIDLDELEKLERAATKGPWVYRKDALGTEGDPALVGPTRTVSAGGAFTTHDDFHLIVALRNEAVPMIQELRELREENARAIAWLDRMSWANATIDTKTTSKGPLEIQLADALAERDALRAELLSVRDRLDEFNQADRRESECVGTMLQALVALRAENERLGNEYERERMRLAGCGVAASANTTESVKQRLTPEHPYWSASYGDVCAAVDREMALRAEVEKLRESETLFTEAATDAAARKKKHAECARLVRKHIPWAVIEAAIAKQGEKP